MSRTVVGDYEHYEVVEKDAGPRFFTYARCKHCTWTSARAEGIAEVDFAGEANAHWIADHQAAAGEG
jgi:hypothetical protein